MAQNLDNTAQVRRESAQTLLNTLLITDIGENFLENGNLRLLFRWNMQTRLSHQGEQSDRLERDRLTPRVWAGNDHHKELAPQMKIDRHDLAGQQRMASVAQLNAALVV